MRAINSSSAETIAANAGARARYGRRIDNVELKSIPLFACMAENDLKELAAISALRRFEPRSTFVRENAKCDTLHVVSEGTIELFSGSDDQETVIDIVQAGAVLLLASVMAGLPYAAAARTLSPARIIAIPASAIRRLFDRDAAFARAVAIELSRAACRMMEELRSLKTRNSIERLVDWLLQADAQANGSGHFKLPFGKRTLASRLGMTPECLSRSLRNLAEYGVSVGGRDVTVTDRAALVATFCSRTVARGAHSYSRGTGLNSRTKSRASAAC